MSRINSIRESIDSKLDQWHDAALALEVQFDLTKDKALDRLEAQKKRLRETLDQFKDEIEKSVAIAESTKTKVISEIEHMQVQLALGKAEAKDTYAAQKTRLQTAMQEFVNKVDNELEAFDDKLESTIDNVAKKVIEQGNKLDAELEAMETHFELEKAKAETEFEAKKIEIMEKINWFKAEVSDKKQLGKDKAQAFEKDLTAGLTKIRQAFSKLMH